jgi:hypothetical protein
VAAEVAAALSAPVAQVSIVSRAGQTMPGAVGLTGTHETDRMAPLEQSICQYVVQADAPLVVADLRTHPTLHDSFAARQGVVAYAGVPLHNRAGEPIGSLCVQDVHQRTWTQHEVQWLVRRAEAVSLQVQAYSVELRMAESAFAMARARSTSRAAQEAAATDVQESADRLRHHGLVARLAHDLTGVEDVEAVASAVSRYATEVLHASGAAILLLPPGAAPAVVRPAGSDDRPEPDWDEDALLDATSGAVRLELEYAEPAGDDDPATTADGARCTAAQLPLRIAGSGVQGCLLLQWGAGATAPGRTTLLALAELLAPTVEWALLEEQRQDLQARISGGHPPEPAGTRRPRAPASATATSQDPALESRPGERHPTPGAGHPARRPH